MRYHGRPLAGIIHFPFSGRTVWGCVGVGVFEGDVNCTPIENIYPLKILEPPIIGVSDKIQQEIVKKTLPE